MNKAQKKNVVTLCFIMLLFVVLITLFGISEIQYARLTKNMIAHSATVTDIDYSVKKGGYTQKVEISYTINDITYSRFLGTDTFISFEAGAYGDMQIGDTVLILYNPDNPNEIATPKTSSVGFVILIFSICSLMFFTFILVLSIKGAKKPKVIDSNNNKDSNT